MPEPTRTSSSLRLRGRLVVALLTAAVALAAAAPAGAHTLTEQRARRAAAGAGIDLASRLGADGFLVDPCRRATAHKLVCRLHVFSFTFDCHSNVSVSYRSRVTTVLRVVAPKPVC